MKKQPLSVFSDPAALTDEIDRLCAKNKNLREALANMIDLAEYWFNATDRRGMSESEYKTWHALSYGSNSYRKAREMLKDKE